MDHFKIDVKISKYFNYAFLFLETIFSNDTQK